LICNTKNEQWGFPTHGNCDDADSMISGTTEHTQLAGPLADSQGNEISNEELNELVGAASEPTIGCLQNMTNIGMGGIGTVFSAHDPVLHREIAIKILRPAYRNQLNYVTSFIREARITAQIDHPNVIPVHRLGVFEDAGTYFTMKRVEGVTLAYILRKLKENDAGMIATYTRQRLLEIFISICNGVAFAHSKGIIHRDLKPANIMVGNYGEVFIADWGIALYREKDDNSQSRRKIELGELPDIKEEVSESGRSKKVSGTPAFMAPEQVTGQDDQLDCQTDVYALGTILYSILTWEQSPFEGASTVTQVMRNVVSRKYLRPRRRAPRRKIPYELEAITLKAMQSDKKQRYDSVISLLADVRNYMAKYPVSAYSPQPLYRLYKFIRRRPLVPVTLLAALMTLGIWRGTAALSNYMESTSLMSVINNLQNDCNSARNTAISTRNKLHELYTQTGKTETVGSGMALRSRYLRYSNEFTLACNNIWDHLMHFLQLDTNAEAASQMLAELLTGQLKFALAVGNDAMLTQVGDRLQLLPENIRTKVYSKSPQLASEMAMLKQNMGELLIKCQQPDVKISALRQPDHRSGETGQENDLQENVIFQLQKGSNKLKAGCYLLTVSMPGRREVRFPVSVHRNLLETVEVELPERYPEGMTYIPGGTFVFGDRTFDDQFVRTYLPGFFISRHEVTIAEYLQYWKNIASPELRERYRAYVDDTANQGRKLMPLWDDKGNILVPYSGKMPVIGITAAAMEDYCRYMSQKTNFKYRLPTALEWEKAARGVDGREYVWGNDYYPNYACINQLDQAAPGNLPSDIGSYPTDCSVYGVYDLTGNARELVTNPGSWQYYTVKGSSFNLSQRFARAAAHAYASNLSDVGFRCVVGE